MLRKRRSDATKKGKSKKEVITVVEKGRLELDSDFYIDLPKLRDSKSQDKKVVNLDRKAKTKKSRRDESAEESSEEVIKKAPSKRLKRGQSSSEENTKKPN